eukprot:TRINITY_DN48218_c0_g1_i1.p1 TRINITY_DN48218_c0_g1~~TRINITY_DN48218_c0_g1_i1.p1  ORF type:complete len:318 (+),score=50.88 TRINITY_DN48218_c0_g1_i1:100-1053(+)
MTDKAVEIVFRNDFIDTNEAQKEFDAIKRRCRSLPPREREVDEHTARSCDYVLSLQQRAEQLAIFARQTNQMKQVQKVQPKAICSGRSETASTTDMTEVPTLTITTFSHLRRPSGQSQGSLPSLDSTPSTPSSKSTPDAIACFDQDSKPAASESPGPACSGSAGHPEFCQRPCIYFLQGRCTNGAACGYCHMGHPQRPFHLDKSQRTLLQNLPQKQVIAMAIPCVRERFQAIIEEEDPSVRQELRKLLEELTGVLEKKIDAPLEEAIIAGPRKLANAFSKMPITTILRHIVSPDDEDGEVITELRNSIRCLMKREVE